MEFLTPLNKSRVSCGRWVAVLLGVLLLGVTGALSQSTLVFPQVVEGPGASSVLLLINAGTMEDTGQIEFFSSAGQPLELTVEGTRQASIPYTIAAGGFTVVEASGGESLSSGYALVRSSIEESRLAGTLRILLGDDATVFLDAPARRDHLVFVEQTESVRTGLAIVNRASEESTLLLEALNDQGEVVAQQTLPMDAGHQLARFVDQLFTGLSQSFQGVLRASSGQLFSLMGVSQDASGRLGSLPASRLEDTELNMPGPELFSGELALGHVADQLAHGPRPTGSGQLLKAGDEIQSKLRALGWTVTQDLHTLDMGSTQVPVRNLVASLGQGPTVILGAHYDSRIWADQDLDSARQQENVPGANDGGSGTAVLLELARVISDHYLANNEIRLVFFDAEDNGNIQPWSQRPESLLGGWIIGSSLYAGGLDLGSEEIQFMILVDMVGDMNQRFPQEAFSRSSAPDLVEEIWNSAAVLGFEDVFVSQSGPAILDDHRPFIDRGIPAVDIIDLDYPFWHTTQDTLDKVSADSLERVGLVLQTFLMQRGVIERITEQPDQ